MGASFLSNWTDVVVDIPNAPSSSDLTVSLRALNDPGHAYGARVSWRIAGANPSGGSKVVTVGITDVSTQHAVAFGVVGFASVLEDVDGSLEEVAREEYVFSADRLSYPVLDLAITLAPGGAITFRLNGALGAVSVGPIPDVFTGARTVTIRSSPFYNGVKRTSIGDLDSFGVSSGATSNTEFWTDFVQSFEVP